MDSWTIFDLVALAVIVISTVMSLGRGLIREAFSVVSFLIGGVSAWFCVVFLEPPLKSVISPNNPSWIPGVLLVVVGFLAAYSLAAFVGGRLSKLIHTSPEIGVLDRIAGAGFGILRGFVAMVLFVLLVKLLLPDGEPDFVYKSWSYKSALGPTADWADNVVLGFINELLKLLGFGAGPDAPTTQ